MMTDKINPLLERVKRTNALKWENGGLTLVKMPMLLGAVHLDVYRYHLTEKRVGTINNRDILYELGLFQGEEAFNVFSEIYGYSKKISDKGKLLDVILSQSELTGHGHYKWVKKDFSTNSFIAHGDTIFAKIYRQQVGISKVAIEHQVRAVLSKFVELLIGVPCFCIETQCIAKGDKFCEFLVKPIDSWDPEDPLVIEQKPEKIKSKKFSIF